MPRSPARSMARCAMFTALLCIGGMLSIPLGETRFTMQNFVLFLALLILGGKDGTIACLAYLVLGAMGLPVFSGFQGGLGVLLGPTGGYLTGFLLCGLVYWAMTSLSPKAQSPGLILGQLVGYGCGALWYALGYLGSIHALGAALLQILPYVIPDGIKLWLAHRLSRILGLAFSRKME